MLAPIARLSHVLLWFTLALLPTGARADDAVARSVQELVDALQREGCLTIAGRPVAASYELVELYRRHAFAPLWQDRAAVEDLRATIDEVTTQGLDPGDYPDEPAAKPTHADARATAEADLLRTQAFVRVARDVRFGRTSRPEAIAPIDPDELHRAIVGRRLREYVAGLEPRAEIYTRLREALSRYRGIEERGGWPAIPDGPALKPGAFDPRLGVLRQRLEISGDLAPGASTGTVYDEALVDAVRLFQSRHGLDHDGVIGRATLETLNVPVARRIDQIRAALERCRLHLHDLPPRFVMVNIAGYRVMLFEDGRVTWRARAIVGTPFNETPEFGTQIDAVILNPTWTIPESIVEKEILRDARNDPGYFRRKRISRVGEEYVQAAGPGNALGRLKLSMPNPHSVYLHDTPTKSLFDRSRRTFSHGCVRIERPVELASLVLDDPAWTVKAIESVIAKGKTRYLRLRTPVPVFVQYWSVTVNRQGIVEFLPDIYGRDEAVLRALATSRTCR